MRCILGPKKIRKLERQTGLKIRSALCRGNTDHRVDILTEDGKEYALFKDGTLTEGWWPYRKMAVKDGTQSN